DDGVDTDPFDQDLVANRLLNLSSHVVEPGRASRAFCAGFSNQEGAAIALVNFLEHLRQRAEGVMPEWNCRAAEIPLIEGVIIDAQHIQILGPSAEFRLLATG